MFKKKANCKHVCINKKKLLDLHLLVRAGLLDVDLDPRAVEDVVVPQLGVEVHGDEAGFCFLFELQGVLEEDHVAGNGLVDLLLHVLDLPVEADLHGERVEALFVVPPREELWRDHVLWDVLAKTKTKK